MNKLEVKEEYSNQTFEDIKHVDEFGNEYWYAREIMKVLEYSKWENFEKVIAKAKEACENSGMSAFEHFPDVRKTIKMPKTHYNVGKSIRETIKKIGGTMPEDLPTPEKSLKELEKGNNKLITK